MKSILEYLLKDTLINTCSVECPECTSYVDMTLEQFKSIMNDAFSTELTRSEEDLKYSTLYFSYNDDHEIVFLPESMEQQRVLNTRKGGMELDAVCPQCDDVMRILCNGLDIYIPFSYFRPDKYTRRFMGIRCLENTVYPYRLLKKAEYVDTKVFAQKEYREYDLVETNEDGRALFEEAISRMKENAEVNGNELIVVVNRSNDILNCTFDRLNKLFAAQHLTNRSTFNDYLRARFYEWISTNCPWVLENPSGLSYLFDIFVCGNNAVYKDTKSYYPGREIELVKIVEDKRKEVMQYCKTPLYDIFICVAQDVLRFLADCVPAAKNDTDTDTLRSTLRIVIDTISMETSNCDKVVVDMLNAIRKYKKDTEQRTICFAQNGTIVTITNMFTPVATFLI